MKLRITAIMFIFLSMLLIACSKDEETEKVEQPEEETEEIVLTEEEAIAVLEEYQVIFSNIVDHAADDGELQQYGSIDEVKAELLTIMTEDFADATLGQYFEEKNEIIYLIETEEPIWFDEEEAYELEQTDDQAYEISQEQLNAQDQLVHTTYVISWDDEKWRLNDLLQEEVELEEENGAPEVANPEEEPSQDSSVDNNDDSNNDDNNTSSDGTAESDNENNSNSDDSSNTNAGNNEASTNNPEEPNNTDDGANQDSDTPAGNEDNNGDAEDNPTDSSGNSDASISEGDAVELVKQHLSITDDSTFNVVVDHLDENGNYVVQVFEVMENEGVGHTATFGWYIVNKNDGSIAEM
ncbi:hypothetical protein [Gracilibacillus alcaliphilus]|uniref:hypothetical protein n=1 Tax=Gracilibacillus alcaliphilus TaxID=1401441 RepID=UPI0019595C0E|nr:hypothetical protein [Gracilibacillus alcaliphilus]MBM7676322.1 hypothetical protein [Gracilibacillus alcaliphilus]